MTKVQSQDAKYKKFEFELQMKQENKILVIQTEDIINHRIFSHEFTHQQLVNNGFHPRQTMIEISEIIERAIIDNNTDAKLIIGYVNDEKEVSEEYQSGDKLQIRIKLNNRLTILTYDLLLNEIEQSNELILEKLVKDLRNEIKELRHELQIHKTETQKKKFEQESEKNTKSNERFT